MRAVDAEDGHYDISGADASFGDIRQHFKKRVGKFGVFDPYDWTAHAYGNQNENLYTAAAAQLE